MTRVCSLITGVAGFIGSHLAERLIRDGQHVIGVDCFADYYPRRIKEQNLRNLVGHDRFHLVEGDIVDLDLAALLNGSLPIAGQSGMLASTPAPRYVYHLAAQAGVRASWGSSFQVYTRDNVLATQHLLEATKAARLEKFVYASSSSVYGDAESFPTPEALAPRPISPYGVTKLAGEHLGLLYWRQYGVPVVCLRYFTVYGPRQRPDMAFHRFIRAILSDKEIAVYGDGEQSRDFTYVGDTVEGTVRAALSPAVGEVFNIGGGTTVTVSRVISLLEQITGRVALVRHEEAQRGDARHTSADIGRAAAILGYAPRTSLAAGLAAEVSWSEQSIMQGMW